MELRRWFATVSMVLVTFLRTQPGARAGIVLVGEGRFIELESVGQNTADPYRFSTNFTTDHFSLQINGGSGFDVSSALAVGDNVFTLMRPSPVSPPTPARSPG